MYPYTLEPHIITLESSRRTTIAAHAARREAYLRSREDDKDRRKREALRKIAPGFQPSAVLVPMKTHQESTSVSATFGNSDAQDITHVGTRSVMDDLVDQLAALDYSSSNNQT